MDEAINTIVLIVCYLADSTPAPSTSAQAVGASAGVNSIGISGIIGRARDLLHANARSMGSTVNRALSCQPKRRRL